MTVEEAMQLAPNERVGVKRSAMPLEFAGIMKPLTLWVPARVIGWHDEMRALYLRWERSGQVEVIPHDQLAGVVPAAGVSEWIA